MWLIFPFVLLLASTLMFGQEYPFLPVPGLPQSIRNMLQDHLGRLWIASSNDVVCFDGIRFYSLHDFGFPSVQAMQLAEDNEGAIWIASGAGLHRFDRGKLETIRAGFGTSIVAIAPNVIVASLGDANSIAGKSALFRIQHLGAKWQSDRLADLFFQGRLAVDRNKSVLFVCPQGWCETRLADVIKWQAGRSLRVTAHLFPTPVGASIATLLRDRFSCVWLLSNTKSYYQCPQDAKPKEINIRSNASLASEAEDGAVMLPATNSLTIGRPGAFRVVTSKNGLPTLGDVLPAKDGTFWLSSGGLFRWALPGRMEFWTERQGIDDVVWSIQRIDHRLSIAAGNKILRLSGDKSHWEAFASAGSLGNIQHLLAESNGNILAATRENGVLEFGAQGALISKSEPGGTTVKMLARTPDGQVWAAGSGVMRVNRNGNRLVTRPENLPRPWDLGSDMEVDPMGRLWACYAGGLVRKDGSDWRRITAGDGLLENNCSSLATTANGDVWYGYRGIEAFSLLHFDKSSLLPQIHHFRASPGADIGSADISFFDADRRNWLWRGTAEGVYLADQQDATEGHWIHFDANDGLPSADMNSQAFLDDIDGSVWFGAARTVVHLWPTPGLARPRSAPQVFVSGFSWNGESPRLVDAISTLPRDTDVIAHLGSLQFDRRSALRFRYRLQPAQKSWQETRSFDVRLGHLPWGANTLEVEARLASGPWSAVASKSFTVTPPVWGTWPFWVFAAGTLLTLFAAAVGWRKRMDAQMIPALPDLKPYRDTALEPQARELVDQTLDGRYRVAHVIAKGGFAAIAKGWDLDRERECAIKIFRQDLPGAEKIGEWFSREVSALERVRHPNIVEVYGHGTTPSGSPYLVMELVKGRTLREAIPSGGLSLRRISVLLRQLGNALGALHAEGIYHRDLKPENIMLRSNGAGEGELVLIDFSIAIIKDSNTTLHILTRPEGTSNYMTPEHARGFANAATDIHGLALVFMEMLSGKNINELLPNAGIDYSTPARHFLRERRVPLSSGSLDLLCAALEFHPRDRPSDVVVFASRIATDLETGR